MLFNKDLLEKEIKEVALRFSEETKLLNSGRVNPEVIANVDVEAYGTTSKLNALGQVMVEDAINAKVTVWDKGVLQAVYNAIQNANLGLNLSIESDFIRLKFNPITEEDRKEKIKELGQMLEEARIRIRQVRHKFVKTVDDLTGVSEDEQKRDKEQIQKIIDAATKELESVSDTKEKALMTV